MLTYSYEILCLLTFFSRNPTMWSLSLVLVVFFSLGSTAQQDPLVVMTLKGKVRGKSVGGKVDIWYNIPYAKPPIGDLRYRHPRTMDTWTGIKNATTPPNSCTQIYDDFFGNFEGSEMWNPNTPTSEDCLYITVVVPKPRPTKAAVLVWIYGGGFFAGTSTLDVYDYRSFAKEQNVIVVAMNYRLANLGFLYMDTASTPGNAGLFDQRLALEWIHDNIEFFGGDSNKITLMGESAGAVSVSLHLLSPLTRNLFNQAIMQSGSATVPWGAISKKEARFRSMQLAEAVNCTTGPNDSDEKIVSCLRATDPDILVNNEPVYGITDFPFVPVIDGSLLDQYPIDYLNKGNFKKTNILMGSNSQEGFYFLMYFLPNLLGRNEHAPITRKNFTDIVQKLYPCYNNIAKEAITYEYTDWLKKNDVDANRNMLDKMVGDHSFTCNVNQFADFYANDNNSNVYMYNFRHRSNANKWPKWAGTLHGDEILFLFGHPINPSESGFTEEEEDLTRRMMTYWGNFVKTG